jgi:hypothetical protein
MWTSQPETGPKAPKTTSEPSFRERKASTVFEDEPGHCGAEYPDVEGQEAHQEP